MFFAYSSYLKGMLKCVSRLLAVWVGSGINIFFEGCELLLSSQPEQLQLNVFCKLSARH